MKRITTTNKHYLAEFFNPLSLLILFCALAITSTSYASKDPLVNSTPDHVIKTTLQKITTFSNNTKHIAMAGTNSHQKEQLRQFIEQEIIPNFDFDNMAHWITGRYGHNMTEQDKVDFKRSLRETFLSSLAKHLGSFDAKNTRVKLYRPRYRGHEEAFVNTTIYRPDRITVNLDFRMRRANNTWKIIDIKANGSSAVLYYRRHFISQLRQYQNQQQPFYQSRQ